MVGPVGEKFTFFNSLFSTSNIREVIKFYNLGDKTFETDFNSKLFSTGGKIFMAHFRRKLNKQGSRVKKGK